jgi:hypothetical protein
LKNSEPEIGPETNSKGVILWNIILILNKSYRRW